MKTDELFYELFTIDPQSVFRLAQLELEGEYRFESLTFKAIERRLDGFCHRIDGEGPNVFVEVQGYDDPKIYWRIFQEICFYYQQHDDRSPFVGIILFLDERDDPGGCPFACLPPHQFFRISLLDGLTAVWQQAGALTVLKPLVVPGKEDVAGHIQQWTTEIRALHLPEEKIHTLLELLEYLIIQRFPTLSRKEVETMLNLTPIEDSIIGQELIQIGQRKGRQEGRQEGRQKGRQEGALIGEIRAMQKFLKYPVTPVDELAQQEMNTLKAMLQELEADLAAFN